jgi:hypothetical protein
MLKNLFLTAEEQGPKPEEPPVDVEESDRVMPGRLWSETGFEKKS